MSMAVEEIKFDPAKVFEIKFGDEGGLNTPDDIIRAQVEENIRRGLEQVKPHQPNDMTALLVCGGPSLASCEAELVEAVWRGGKVVAVNGAYQWCLDRNIRPSVMVMLDAREFNTRFVETPALDCKYLLAAQCHPRAFELCQNRDVLIWHACSGGDSEYEMLKKYYFNCTYPVTLGTTVSIRAISLLRMLGFMRIDCFGLDSCWLDGEHHTYAQAENSRDQKLPVWLRPPGRDDLAQRFLCSPWHIKQATDFLDLVKERGEMFQLNVRGPGLIATMLRTGAELIPPPNLIPPDPPTQGE